jgi:hypothetical protein
MNRQKRIEFLCCKFGKSSLSDYAYMTDRRIKQIYDSLYKIYKNMPDYVEIQSSICIRCKEPVLFKTWCSCGIGRAVFDETSWMDDIRSNTRMQDRVPEDEEFLVKKGFTYEDVENGKLEKKNYNE